MTMTAFPHTHPICHTPAVWHPEAQREGYTMVLFRKTFTLAESADHLDLWISASERFILYFDGRLVARGPSRSDPQRWGAVKVQLGPIGAGLHVLAVRVFHLGSAAGIGQLGGPAFLLVHAEDRKLGEAIDTSAAWKCMQDVSRSPLPSHAWGGRPPYFVVGAGERLDAARAPWSWELPAYDDTDWVAAKVVCGRAADEWGNFRLEHILRPEPLPAMEERADRFARVAEASTAAGEDGGLLDAATRWILSNQPLSIPANTQARLVIDRGELTNAYPQLTVSGGRGAAIGMVWAEAGYVDGRAKGNRNDTKGKNIFGYQDEFHPDGGEHRTFQTLWFRAFRYVELTIRSAGQPLRLEKLIPVFSGYPMSPAASFHVDAEHRNELEPLWDISWRTARLCAHETFFDCPHYEQAQFPGDTRVQAIYHYLVTNDDRLARKAIDDFHASRLEQGLAQCRFPSRALQIIPTFSLYWIGMLHDFLLYRGDGQFVARYLPFARDVLAWFLRRRREDGILGFIEAAPFVDWTSAFPCGNAPQDEDGGSAILTLLLARACLWQAELEAACGFSEVAPRWRREAGSLRSAARQRCWSESRKLLADTPAQRTFSQHAQVEATLSGAWPMNTARKALRRAMKDSDVAPPGTLYYRFYVAQALRASGLRDDIFPLLGRWTKLLENSGLTTWPETDVNPRSDCHAWSVTPAIEFMHTILGVEPAANGFSSITFRPTLGPLQSARGVVPTPHGPISVTLQREGKCVHATLTTPVPAEIPATRQILEPGEHRVTVSR